MGEPLVWFPEEVWEIILNDLEDSTDVWNVFRAFPQLDNSTILQKKKPLWLFGLVIPILIPWKKTRRITTNMLLSCRQTCRHWSTAVDTFLENQPQLRAYDHKNPTSGRFPWNPRSYMEDMDIDPYDPERKRSNHIGGVKFDNDKLQRPKPKSVTKFLQALGEHPPGRNPFLSRSLSITAAYGGGSTREMRDQFWNDTISIHQKFGKHVWFYKLQFRDLDELDRRRYFADCIGKLTNLKSLHLMGSEDMDEVYNEENENSGICSPELLTFMEALENDLPPFPHLETLKIDGEFKHLDLFLIRRLSAQAQIRRVELEFDMWKPEYSQLFPNLTELDLLNCEPANLKDFMLSLEAPQLAKLQLGFYCGEGAKECKVGMEEDIFQWLKRFPLLRSFMLGEGCQVVRIEEKGTLSPEAHSITSLQFLSIRTSFGMSFKFLLCLPSLRHLNLFVPLEPVVIDHSTNPVVRIREELQTGKLYNSNVWELLPKLSTVNLLVEEDDDGYIRASYEFYREDYEKTKRAAAASPPTSEVSLSRLRQDIFDYTRIGKVRNARGLINDDSDDDDDDDEESDDEFHGDYGCWPIF